MQADSSNNFLNNIAKLQWACRRGMLELDVLLGNFLKEVYPSLPVEDKQLFVDLLDSPDPELFAWLMGHEASPAKHHRMVDLIRRHARSRV